MLSAVPLSDAKELGLPQRTLINVMETAVERDFQGKVWRMEDMANGEIEGLSPPRPLRPYPAPDLRDKFRRMLWNFVNATFYRMLPTPFFAPRRAILRLFGARIALGALPYPGAKIWAPWNLVMEQNSCIADGVNCYSVATIIIGKGSTVSQGAYLCTPSHDFRQPDFPLVAAEIHIGAGSWVSTEAFIGPGVRVGELAVVGARTVVSKSVPQSAIVVGNPARIVGWRG